MATFPRPGIINLNLADVSQLAQQIEENDWLRTALREGGKYLSERDKEILYNRMYGIETSADRSTAKEGFSKGVKKIGGFFSDATDTIGNLLKAPFTNDEVETEVDEEAVENIEIPVSTDDELMTSPMASQVLQAPTSLVSPSGTQVLQAPNVQASNAVASNALMAPQTPNVQASPVAPQVLQSPDASDQLRWSQLYNIDPERATFDWNRIAPRSSGGAASTVQARLAHDADLDVQIASLVTQLRKDMLTNGWTTTSPEFIDRYGEIQALNAQKFVKSNSDALTKMMGLSDKEFDKDLKLQKQAFDEEKEITTNDQKAFEATNKAMNNLMGEKYSTPAKYGAIMTSLANVVADPNNINETSIRKAVKSFIQAIDDSVVMGNEAESFADQSYLGQIRAELQRLVDDNIYSADRLEEMWTDMEAYLQTYNSAIDNMVEIAKPFYSTFGGSNPAVLDSWANLMKANTTTPPKPDFSIVTPWWEGKKNSAKNNNSDDSPPSYTPEEARAILAKQKADEEAAKAKAKAAAEANKKNGNKNTNNNNTNTTKLNYDDFSLGGK